MWSHEANPGTNFRHVVPVNLSLTPGYRLKISRASRMSELVDRVITGLAALGGSAGRAFAVGKVLLAYRVLRENQLTYDGQDFFDNAHQHPDGTLASNLVNVVRADPVAPDVIEAREELTAAVDRLMASAFWQTAVRVLPT